MLGDMHEVTVTNSPAGGPPQDRELLLVDGENTAHLRARVAYLAELSGRLAPAELGMLAATLQARLAGRPVRAAVVAASPDQARERFARLLTALDGAAGAGLNGAAGAGINGGDGAAGAVFNGAAGAGLNGAVVDATAGVFLGHGSGTPGIGLLFPGQGSGKGDGGALARRFETVADLYRTVTLPASDDPAATVVAQPRITRYSVAGLRVLSLLGISAVAAAGHSLGELGALHWAGAMTEAELFALAAERGRVMMHASEGGGAMAGIGADPDVVEPLLSGEPVVIAGYNGPGQTVISGPATAVERVREAAAATGVKTARIRVSHAFHSPAVAPAAAELDRYLAGQRFRPLARCVLSTLTGDVLPADADLRQLLVRQVREPVRFSQAVTRMAPGVDLLIEVGPGRVLSGLAARIAPDTPVIPLSTDGPSLSGVLGAAAAAWVLGMTVRHDQLMTARPARAPLLDEEAWSGRVRAGHP
jgi:enediyne polyketide synthase